jgi:hypothetical protein
MAETPRDNRTQRDLRTAIARECLAAMISNMPPQFDRTTVDERAFAEQAVAFADALIEALEGNAR